MENQRRLKTWSKFPDITFSFVRKQIERDSKIQLNKFVERDQFSVLTSKLTF